jgi:hypothetical protein
MHNHQTRRQIQCGISDVINSGQGTGTLFGSEDSIPFTVVHLINQNGILVQK